MGKSWAAAVINYEAGPLLVDCVRSILADTSAGDVELVVVDNGSSDGSIAAMSAIFPDVHVVRAPGNVGYARAANLGTAATYAPIIAVLNADLTISAGTAAAMLRRLDEEPELGVVGPRVQNLDGTDYPSARRYPSIPVAIGHGVLGLWWPTNPFTARYRALDADAGEPRDVDWLSGSAMWFRRAALDAVGGWDERYFMYMEDIDLCTRLRAAHWRVAYEPAGKIMHVQGASTSRHPYRMITEHHRSAWRFLRQRLQGVRAVLLPFAAMYLGFRLVLALGAHAARSLEARRGG